MTGAGAAPQYELGALAVREGCICGMAGFFSRAWCCPSCAAPCAPSWPLPAPVRGGRQGRPGDAERNPGRPQAGLDLSKEHLTYAGGVSVD